jgi:hypothetical protein
MEIMEDPYPGATPEEHDRMLSEVRTLITSSPNIPSELKSELSKRAGAFLEVKQTSGGGHFHGGQLGWSRWVAQQARKYRRDLYKQVGRLPVLTVQAIHQSGAASLEMWL